MEAPSAECIKPARRLSPAWIAAGVIAALVIALLLYGLAARPSTRLAPGSPVPDFDLAAFDGSRIDLDAARGKVVVLNFYASWCDPCRREAPAMQQVWQDYQPRGVLFYGIAYKDAAPKAQAFMQEFGLGYASGADPSSRISRAYGVTGVPETFVIDAQGRLAHHFVGEVTAGQLGQELDKLIGTP